MACALPSKLEGGRGWGGGGVGCLAGFKALPCASASVPFGLAQEQDV